jgi:ABC-2 type transport system permease protein
VTTMTFAAADSATMLGRSLRHGLRHPLTLLTGLITPIVLLLMFVYILGDSLGSGIAGPNGGRGAYLAFITPSMLLLTTCYGGGTTAVTVSVDLTEGIVRRFRSMAIFRPSLLIGHVLGGVIRTMAAVVLVLAVAVLIGFRSGASPLAWLAAAGLLTLLALGLTWLNLGFGAVAQSPSGASMASLPLQLLPILSSAFAPTDRMPAVVRWVAQNQPLTPVIDTLRGLLLGSAIGHRGLVAVAWCVGLTLAGFAWSVWTLNRRRGGAAGTAGS